MFEMNRDRWLALTGAACATAVLAGGCASPEDAPDTGADQPELVFTTPAADGPLDEATWFMSKEPQTLDLDKDAAGANSSLIMSNVCERLMQLQPDLTTGLGLAEEYEWTTPETLVFTLREGVTFHSGEPMTADDVVWSLERHAADTGSESDEFVNVTDIEKTGENEVTISLTQPDAIFLQAMAGNAGVILERDAVEAQGDAFGTPGGEGACTGPFSLASWDSGRQIVLERFDDYWNTDKAAKAEQVTFRWADDDAIVNSLVTGEADGAYLENISSATQLASGSNTTVAQGPDSRVWNMMVTERGGLDDPRLRRALSIALDREGIAEAGLAGFGLPAREPMGPAAWGYEEETFRGAYEELVDAPVELTDEDIQRASELVEAADPSGPVLVASDGTSVRNVIANALVGAAESIGLEAEIVQIPTQQYGDFYSSADARQEADLFIDDYYISKNDPMGFYKNGASDSTVQWVLEDPEYDELVQSGRAALDDAERAEIAVELGTRWAESMPWIPVVQSPSTVALSDRVTGVPASGTYRYYAWAADLGAREQ